MPSKTKAYFQLAVSDPDGNQPMVGLITDSRGTEVDDLIGGGSYEAKLDFYDKKTSKVKDALDGIQGRFFVTKALMEVFSEFADFADVSFPGSGCSKQFFAVIPKEVISVERTEQKERSSLGIPITTWAIKPDVLDDKPSAFHELVMGWVVDDEFKQKCEEAAPDTLSYEPVRIIKD